MKLLTHSFTQLIENCLHNFINFCYDCFLSPFFFLLQGLIWSSSVGFLRRELRLFILDFYSLPIYEGKVTNFPLNSAFTAPYRFLKLYFSFPFVSKYFKTPLETSLILYYLEILYT